MASKQRLLHLEHLNRLSSLGFTADRLNANELHRLARLKQLRSIGITSGVLDDEAMANIVAVRNLEYLSFLHTQLDSTMVARISRCEKLISLSFRDVLIKDEDLEHLAHLSNLRYLTLYATDVTSDGISHLECLRQLIFLNLAYSGNVDDEILGTIRKLESLQELCLNGTSVSKAGGMAIRQARPGLSVEHLEDRPGHSR
jgi:hypothetical protein